METLILQTENKEVTKELLHLIKNMKSVKFIAVENDDNRLNVSDLATPGRLINEEDLNELAMVMENESAFKKSDEVFDEIVQEIHE